MDHKLDCGIWGGIFAVPNAVVDNYIKLAGEASLKVLLYMMRHSGEKISRQDIAAALNITEEQTEEAFVFWENANIISSASPAVSAPEPQPAAAPMPEKQTEPKKKAIVPDRSQYNISPSEIAARIESSEDMKGFFFTAESIFGQPMNHTQQRSFIYLIEYLGISTEVLLLVIAYAVKAGKSGVKYIEQMAYDFNERGINTLDLAQKEIKKLEDKFSFEGKIKSIFGIQTNFSSRQKTIVDEWREKDYSLELIKCAFDRAVDSGKGANIPYANGTLLNWEKDGITTAEQVMNEKKKYDKPAGDYSFDIEDLRSLANNFGDI